MASGTSFFSAHGDKLFLAATLLALGASASLAYLGAPAASNVPEPALRGKAFVPAGADALNKELESLRVPFATAHTNLTVLVSEVRVSCTNAACKALLPWTAEVCWRCSSKQPPRGSKTDSDGDGIPDVVEISNGMDPSKNDVGLDLDKDGFANGEELAAGTKPNDLASRPPMITKLRVEEIGDRPLRFVLKEITKAGTSILLQVSLAGVDKLNAKVGETVNGWQIKSFDDATKTAEIAKDGEVLKLTRGKPVEKNRRAAILKSLSDPTFKNTTVVPGARVKIDGIEYLVVEITPNTVELRDATPGSPKRSIPMESAAEKQGHKASHEAGSADKS